MFIVPITKMEPSLTLEELKRVKEVSCRLKGKNSAAF